MSLTSWLRAIEGIAPLILVLIPGIPKELIQPITKAIQAAEQIPGATGPEKLEAAKDLISASAATINAAKPGTVNVEAIDSAVEHGIATVIAVTNVTKK